jgi:hypothetical protein
MDGMSRQVEANLAALIESTDDLIWSVDLNFQLLAFNSALQADFQDNFGVRIDVGMKAEDYLPPSRSVLWTPLYTRALREGPFKADYPLADGRLLELAFNPIVVDGKKTGALCANISETGCPSTITVGRGKKSHLDEHKQDQYFFRCVGSFGA